MQQALFKCETTRLELKSSRSFLAIKRCQRTKSKKAIKLLRSSIYKLAHMRHAPLVVKMLSLHEGRGSGGENVIFKIAPTPHLSILICSNMYRYDMLKILLIKIDHNLCWIRQTLNCSALTESPVLHAIFSLTSRAHAYGAFQVCKHILLHS
jgi:hypothetical protein